MLFKRPAYRRFEYSPRYYNPDRDPENVRRREMRFERKTRRGRNRPIYWVIGMLILTYIIFTWLQGGAR